METREREETFLNPAVLCEVKNKKNKYKLKINKYMKGRRKEKIR